MGQDRNGDGKDVVARGLGWFSVGLGAAQVAAPRAVTRLIGIEPKDDRVLVMRAMGVREIASGVAILALPRSAAWLWVRVAGDALDLALLGAAAKTGGVRRVRIAGAAAAVAGVAVADVIEASRLARAQSGGAVRKSITINRPPEDVERAWQQDRRDRTASPGGSVRFVAAPGGRGTEIHLELAAGDATAAHDELRRFKQDVETGEVVRSDGTPEGQRLARHFKQRPAQPRAAGEAS